LREGRAIQDFFQPERIVLGGADVAALNKVREIYSAFDKDKVPFLISDWFSSETIKYAANAFLAMKVTFINEIANLTQTVGGDIEIVSKGIGLDSRIGEQFLNVGPGYGGSCFPRTRLPLQPWRAVMVCNSKFLKLLSRSTTTVDI
jgi:UDPglucose 6-dehydrogenase